MLCKSDNERKRVESRERGECHVYEANRRGEGIILNLSIVILDKRIRAEDKAECHVHQLLLQGG
jgi:hypothetical protein